MVTKRILVLIYLIALLPRLWQLGATPVYVDEVTWVVKGKEAIYALAKGNLDYFRNRAWWNDRKDTYAIGWPTVLASGLAHVILAGSGQYSLHWLDDMT